MKIDRMLSFAIAAVSSFQAVFCQSMAAAQTPPAPRSDTVPDAQPPVETPKNNPPSPPTTPTLPQTDNGVVKPPSGVDPEIVQPTPAVKSDMPIIKPSENQDGVAK